MCILDQTHMRNWCEAPGLWQDRKKGNNYNGEKKKKKKNLVHNKIIVQTPNYDMQKKPTDRDDSVKDQNFL